MNTARPLPLKGIKLAAATLVLGLGSFMNILDLTIVNVAVPTTAICRQPRRVSWPA